MLKPHNKLLLALILGILLGTVAHLKLQTEWMALLNTHVLQAIGQIFLRLIFMVVVPMIFCALVLGIFELGKEHGIGLVALKTLGYTVVASSIAVLLGITLVNLVKPGAGFTLTPEALSSVETIRKNATQAKPISQTIIELVPKNPIDAAVRAFDGEILALMVFALFFGFAGQIWMPQDLTMVWEWMIFL
jgi:DAACS family dicarboxylate/amino acid:cation (Na+ or H+) symporter